MDAEVQWLVRGFDFVFILRKSLVEFLGRKVALDAFTDRKTLYNVVAKDVATAERRLHIDILVLWESYEKGELSRGGRIPGTENIADALRKLFLSTKSPPLEFANYEQDDDLTVGLGRHTTMGTYNIWTKLFLANALYILCVIRLIPR